MPIKIPNDLPARATLEQEGVMVMSEASAARQDIRALRIGLLNLMPNKIRTETQFARLLGATPRVGLLSLCATLSSAAGSARFIARPRTSPKRFMRRGAARRISASGSSCG